MQRIHLWLLLCLACLLAPVRAAPPAAALIEIEGAIGPATSRYFDYALQQARAQGARLIVLRLDTPGGLDGPMRDIIKQILASPIPVVAYVGPAGARAASAGTYLLYASHVAAMAPATNLGAATPITIGGAPSSPAPADESPPAEGDTPAQGDTTTRPPASASPASPAERKAVNDASAYLRSLAERRGRNADWAEQAVREGASLSADAALRLGVIEVIATDAGDLLEKLQGRRIAWRDGSLTLDTRNLALTPIEPTWQQRFLSVLTNPSVAYLLMLIGVYGLLLEGYSPGAILPGVVGGISLLLALYAFQLLPINYVGLALLGLGIALIVAETLVPSVGVLGIGGVVAFAAGSILLMDSDIPGYHIPLGLVAGAATGAALLMLLSLSLLLRSSRRRPVQGQSGLAGCTAVALQDFTDRGWVAVRGERWQAQARVPIQQGQRLRITRVQDLLLEVEPVEPNRP